jgi:HlyD family secretion protein
MKPALFFLAPAAVLGLAATSCRQESTPPFTFQTAPAQRGNIIQEVSASGSLSAVVRVDVGSQVSGKISALNADFNSRVKKDDVVAEIDSSLYTAILRQTEGELASARASATLKKQNLERKQILFPKQAATQFDLEEAVAELAQAEATVTIREAAVDRARIDLGYCRITAPVDGIVISRVVDLGQTVAAAMTTPILFTIAQDITKMHIKASISESDIGMVKEGQSISFTVDAFPDEVFDGVVSQVRMAPIITTNVVTYDTIISVDNPENKLFPGMTADVSVRVADRTDVPKIPNAALRFSPPEGTTYSRPGPSKVERNERLIYTLEPGSQAITPVVVKVGITDNVDTEIISGLQDGALVVISSTATPKKGLFGRPSGQPSGQ